MRREDDGGPEEIEALRRRNAELAAENARLRAHPAPRPGGEPEPGGRRLALMRALAEASRTIMLAPDLRATLQAITETARTIVGAHQSVCSLTRGTDWAQAINAVSLSEKYAGWRGYDGITSGAGIYAWVCEGNRAVRMTQAELEAHPRWRGFGDHAGGHPPLRGWLAAPLVGGDGRNLGLIQLSDKVGGEFDALDESIVVQLAGFAASAVERAQSEDRLRTSETQLNAVLDSVSDIFYALDAAWRFTVFNAAAERFFGRARDGVLGRVIWDAFPELLGSETERRLRRAMEERRPDTFETPSVLRPDRTLEVRLAAKATGGVTATFSDVTESRKAEAALRESEARLRVERGLLAAIIRQAPVGISIAEAPGGRAVTLNDKALELIGHPDPGGDAGRYERFGAVHPDGRPYAVDDYPTVRAIRRGEVVEREEMLYRFGGAGSAGETIRLEVSSAPVRDGAGRIVAAATVLIDVERQRRAEAALRRSEARLRLAVEAGRMAIWELDLATDALTPSPELNRLLGFPEDAAPTAEEIRARYHPGERERLQAAAREVIARGDRFAEVEYRYLRPDGALRWMMLRAEIHRNPEGRPSRYVGVLLDITERKAVELALQEARAGAEREAARTAAILAQLAEGVIVTGSSGRIAFVNDAAARLHGVERLDVPPSEFASAYHLFTEDGRPFPSERLPLARAALHGETVEDARWRIRRPDGTQVLAVGSARPILGPDGAQAGAVLTLRDDTARATAEAELQRLNANLEAEVAERTAERDRIWQNSNELMGVFERDGRRRSVNPAWARVLGHDEEALPAAPLLDLAHPDDRDGFREALARLASGERPALEGRLRHADGAYRQVAWTGVPAEGVFYAIGRDVTDQRHAEEALRQSQKMEAVGQLTGGIAHDFNNLLAGIMGSLDLMQRRIGQGRTGEVSRYVDAAMTSAQRAAALTHRLLAFSRRQPLDPRPVDANRLVAGMEDLLRRTLGPAVTLDMALAGGLWQTLCDPVQLESAVLNLCINARDAMPEGGRLTVGTANARLDEADAAALRDGSPGLPPGPYVTVSVSDTGTGMPPDVVARAFDPFFTTKPVGQGTGLGLSMVYGFARQSEGHVRIESEPGRGTTIRLLLPRHRGGAAEEDAAAPAGEAPRARAGETVLVVEDEPVVRGLVTEVLRELGYRALEAADGPAGLDILQAPGRVDLLVADLGLPGLNGRQLADEARRTRPSLRVLFITGYAEGRAGAHGALEPGMAMIAKPFAVDDLARTIRGMIGSGRSGEP